MPSDEVDPQAQVIEVYLEMRRAGMGERQAARMLEANHRDIAAYAAANPDFALALEDALAERLERAEARAWAAAHDGDPAMLTLALKSHAPAEWTPPSPEMILKVQQADPLDDVQVAELHKRLEMVKRQQELRAGSIDVESEETPDADVD